MKTDKPPKAFLSYKWEGAEVKNWVERFASDLRRNGVDAQLDVWDVSFGSSFIKYMTRNIQTTDIFFFIMTPKSIEAVEAEEGGGGAVNFEVELATRRKIDGEKVRFIPILLSGEAPASFLRNTRYVDFRDESNYNGIMTELLNDIKGRQRKPPLLGFGHLEAAYRLYELLPAVSGSPVGPLMAKIEAFPGFPFYSFESDHPSRWPPRVDEDRQAFTSEIRKFVTAKKNQTGIARALKTQGTIQSVSSGPMDAEDEEYRRIFDTYMKLRMEFNVNMDGDTDKLSTLLGERESEEFIRLEKQWNSYSQRMPNRLLTLIFRHSHGLQIRNVLIDIEIAGTVYDVLLNGVRPMERNLIEKMTNHRTLINTSAIEGNSTSIFRIWYHYISLAERWDPKPIHIKAEPTQGVLLYKLGAEGLENVLNQDMYHEDGVYRELPLNLPLG
jgi:hypothetical protein